MAHYEGQIVGPDFGFYARDMHTSLIRGDRLIARVNTLSELPPNLREARASRRDGGAGTTFDDAEILAKQACLIRGTNAYNDFVAAACS